MAEHMAGVDADTIAKGARSEVTDSWTAVWLREHVRFVDLS